MDGVVTLAVEAPLARVRLCNPQRRNAMTRAMWAQLRAAFAAIAAHAGVRAVLLQGEGGQFCAGGDIQEYPSFRFQPDTLADFHEQQVWPALQAVLDCPVPVIAQLEGACMGAGLELACASDLRVAGQGARFGAPIALLGFPMAPREAALVWRELGPAATRELLYLARALDAATLAQRGSLHVLAPDTEVAAQAQAMARRVAELAPGAARRHKHLLRALAEAEPTPTVVLTDPYAYADSPEHREGVAAFLARRSPDFTSLS